jgi:diguanylate cyclase (GGDEF)-like protein/PAS domain S-box-containing protein
LKATVSSERKRFSEGGRTKAARLASPGTRSEIQPTIRAFDQAAIGMALVGLDGNWIRVNPAVCHIIGYSEQELLAANFQGITHPDDLGPDRDYVGRMLRGEIRSCEMERRFFHKAGHVVHVLLSVSLICDKKGNPLFFFSQIQDITERRHAEEKLRQSEESYRRLVELSPDAMLVQRKGAIIFANGACAALLGASSAAEILGRRVLDFVHPKDRAAVQERMQTVRHDPGAIPLPRTERKYIGLDGREVDVEVVISPLIYQSEPATEVILRDISERKQAELKLRRSEANLAEAQRFAHLGSFEQDLTNLDELEKNPQRWSDEVFRVFGYGPGRIEASTANFLRAVHPDDRDHLRSAMARAIREGKSYSLDYRIVRPDETERIIHGQSDVVYDEKAGKPSRLVGTVQDITEGKLAEAKLQETNKELAGRVQELQRRSKEITLLSEMGNWLQSCQTAEEAFAVIGRSVQQLFPEWVGALYILSASRNVVETVAAWGEPTCGERVFAPDDCWALRRGQPHRFKHDGSTNSCRHTDPASFSESRCMPLMAQGEALGILHLQVPRMEAGQQENTLRSSAEAEQRLTAVLAEQIALALANLKLRESLRNQSIRDPLTGLFNRRYMEESLEREMSRANRNKKSLALIMMDIDHFKHFNDTFGHQAGDTLLRALGDFLKKRTRGQDIACRYGGEEFALVLSDASLNAALQPAEILREEIKQLNVQHAGQVLGTVSLSMGVALFPDDGLTITEILRAADQALYRAKHEGRDRVCAWSSPVQN